LYENVGGGAFSEAGLHGQQMTAPDKDGSHPAVGYADIARSTTNRIEVTLW
jgi:hypothetical protein